MTRISYLAVLSLALLAVGYLATPARADCSERWLPGEAAPHFDSAAMSVAIYDDGTGPALYAGGRFTLAGGATCNGVAKWTGAGWEPLGSGMSGGQYYTFVRALAVFNGGLVAGGDFTTAGGVPCNWIAKWNPGAPGSWSPLGSGISGGLGSGSSVRALTVFNGELIAGGQFTTAGGVACNNIAKWDGANWAPLGSGMGLSGIQPITALTVFDGELIAGGSFDLAGGVTCHSIAKWNGSTWASLGSGMSGGNQWVFALTVFDGELVAGGGFDSAGGVACNNIAKWDGSTWAPLGGGLTGFMGSYQPPAYALTEFNGALIAGGCFAYAGGALCHGIAEWNPGTPGSWSTMGAGVGGGSGYGPLVIALTTFNGEVIAGGDFTAAGGDACGFWARWSPLWGDADGNGLVNISDVGPFVLALVDPQAYSAQYPGCLPTCDCNHDGAVDGLDVQAFVDLVLGS